MDINKVIKNTINEIETPEGGEDIYNLLRADILTSEIVEKIYFRFYNDIKAYIEDYTSTYSPLFSIFTISHEVSGP